jgi:S1-C subfamily serine protease
MLLAGVLAAGCAPAPTADYQPASQPTAAAAGQGLQRDSLERQLRHATLRVRNRTCLGVGSGSGFAVADRLLVTNRHVVAGADVLQVSTWDGQSIDVDVSAVAAGDDLALVLTRQPLPAVMPLGSPARPGDEVVAIGYPGGDAIEFSEGRVIDRVDGTPFGESTTTLRLTNRIVPGNSGGPVIDADGDVVGVVFALEVATGHGLAVPVETLQALTDRPDTSLFFNPSPC